MGRNCLVFVTDRAFKDKFEKTVDMLKKTGKWTGDILLIHSPDMDDTMINDYKKRRIITHNHCCSLIDTSNIVAQRKKYGVVSPDPPNNQRIYKKLFQYHKIYIFSTFLKQWDRVLYIDSGMKIFGDINRIFKIDPKDKLLAHSDAYPTYEWKLNWQFDEKANPDQAKKLRDKIDLTVDYFQTTILYFNTAIITDNMVSDLIELSKEYYISKTNEQGVMNIYFNGLNKIWEQIPTKDDKGYLYDYLARGNIHKSKYLMLKMA